MNATCSSNLTFDFSNATVSTLPVWLVYQPMEWIKFYILCPSLIIFGSLSQASFVWTVATTPSLHTATYYYLVGLSFSDAFYLLGFGSVRIKGFIESPVRLYTPSISGVLASYISKFAFISSIGFVTLATLERFLAICFPLKHYVLKGTKRTRTLIFVMLLISGLISVVPTLLPLISSLSLRLCFIWPSDTTFMDYPTQIIAPSSSNSTGNLGDTVLYFIPLIINSYMYIRILVTLRNRKLNSQLQLSSGFEQQLRAVAVMVIVNGIIFFLFCAINTMDEVIESLNSNVVHIFDTRQILIWNDFVFISILLNASINPLIYTLTNQRYRHAFKKAMMRLCLYKQYSLNQTSMTQHVDTVSRV